MATGKLQGSCLCGAVRYQIDANIESVCHCHCTMCQKAHGSAFGSYAPVPRRTLQFTDGHDAIHEYRSSPAVLRLFCSTCGSVLLWDSEPEFPDTVFVAVATLDSQIQPFAQRHIHVSTRVPWFEISDPWPKSESY